MRLRESSPIYFNRPAVPVWPHDQRRPVIGVTRDPNTLEMTFNVMDGRGVVRIMLDSWVGLRDDELTLLISEIAPQYGTPRCVSPAYAGMLMSNPQLLP